jgi:hypothetical protein
MQGLCEFNSDEYDACLRSPENSLQTISLLLSLYATQRVLLLMRLLDPHSAYLQDVEGHDFRRADLA